MKTRIGRIACLSALLAFVSEPLLHAQTLESVMKAHRVWSAPPVSIRITGTSTDRAGTQPVRITATQNEEALIEYRSRKQVYTPFRRFEDDGDRVTFHPAPGGFAQLDITGVYLLAQLPGRGVTTDAADPATLGGAPSQRLRIRSSRTDTHYRVLTVRDEFELYVDKTGLLAGISREFYPGSALFHFTLGFAFSDYRNTGGVLLPYRIHRYINGQMVEAISVEAYEVGIPVSSALFQPRRAQ